MRIIRIAVLLLSCSLPLFSQTSSLHGIDTADLDRKADELLEKRR